MDKETKIFIKNSKNELRKMFNDRLDELKESVFIIKAGEERDAKILFIKEYRSWLNKIGVLTAEPKENTKDPEFI